MRESNWKNLICSALKAGLKDAYLGKTDETEYFRNSERLDLFCDFVGISPTAYRQMLKKSIRQGKRDRAKRIKR